MFYINKLYSITYFFSIELMNRRVLSSFVSQELDVDILFIAQSPSLPFCMWNATSS